MTALCNHCSSSDLQSIAPVFHTPVPSQIVRCCHCGLHFLDPFPSDSELHVLYSAEYFCCPNAMRGGYEDYRADEPEIRKTFERRLRFILPYVKPSSSSQPRAALDVGCATGVFLEVLRDGGWSVSGVDLSPFAVEIAREKGLDVRVGDITAAPAGETVDLITLWDVIEHVRDPTSTLNACYERLTPNGLLVLSTPDVSARVARLLGRYWLGYRSAGEHLYFFGRDTIAGALARAGFRVLAITSVGKYMRLDRVITRLAYYTRIFRLLLLFRGFFFSRIRFYVSSGDTLMAVARKGDCGRL